MIQIGSFYYAEEDILPGIQVQELKENGDIITIDKIIHPIEVQE